MTKRIALALQGGGVHAAFAWGVVDRLLVQVAAGEVEIAGISGASSGALNAVALAYGLREGADLPGPAAARTRRMAQAARAKLEEMWSAVAQAAFWSGNPLAAAIALSWGWNIDDSPAARWAETMGAAPTTETGVGIYLNGLLRDVFPHLPAILAAPVAAVPPVMISATEVRHCRRELFVDGAISPAAMRAALGGATAGAIEVHGGQYWDGAYLGNPPLVPLLARVRPQGCDDLLVVGVTPLVHDEAPRGSGQRLNRLREIAFSAALVQEVAAIETVNALAGPEGRPIHLHRLHADARIVRLGAHSKEAPAWDFLTHLRDMGQNAFDAGWPDIVRALGRQSSWDTGALADRVIERGALK